MSDFCFIGPKFDPEFDLDLFGGHVTENELISLEPNWTMAHIAVHVGAFKSVSDARRNGWGEAIPVGWTQRKLPKKFMKSEILICNPSHTMQEWIEKEKMEGTDGSQERSSRES